jgi:hypothetical protein
MGLKQSTPKKAPDAKTTTEETLLRQKISVAKCPRPEPYDSKLDEALFWRGPIQMKRYVDETIGVRECDYPAERMKVSTPITNEQLEIAKRKCIEKRYAYFLVSTFGKETQVLFMGFHHTKTVLFNGVAYVPVTPRTYTVSIRHAPSCAELQRLLHPATKHAIENNEIVNTEYMKKYAELCPSNSVPIPPARESATGTTDAATSSDYTTYATIVMFLIVLLLIGFGVKHYLSSSKSDTKKRRNA